MLIRSSGEIAPGIYLLALGWSCHYVVLHKPAADPNSSKNAEFSLFDPGSSAHIPALLERLKTIGLDPKNLSKVFITHAHSERIGGLPLLKALCPQITVYSSAEIQHQLSKKEIIEQIQAEDSEQQNLVDADTRNPPNMQYSEALRPNRALTEGESVALSADITLHAISLAGHSAGSLGYSIFPQRMLIADESVGYYNGKELAAPGGDLNLDTGINIIQKLIHLDLSGLLLPFGGALTGSLVRKHLQSVVGNLIDMRSECKAALKAGVDLAEIKAAIFKSFYAFDERDPFLRRSLDRTFEAIWQQISAELAAPVT